MSNENFNIDSILDGTLDDLADLPEFRPYPAGTHRVNIKFEQKVVNKHPGFELKMKAVETVELPAGSTEEPLAAGAETAVLFLLDNEIGQGAFKKVLSSLANHYGAKSNRELIAEAQGAECLVVTKQRQNKDKNQTYTDIVELQVV
jgi:hypothetical protein